MRNYSFILLLILLINHCGPVFRKTINNNSIDHPVTVHTLKVGEAQAYLLEGNTALILIDAGWPGNHDKIINKVESTGKRLELIVITHGHIDHYGSAAEVRRRTGCKIAVHPLDENAMANGKTPLYKIKPWGVPGWIMLPLGEVISGVETTRADFTIEENYSLKKYGIDAYILSTSGHTPGSVSVVLNNVGIFVGDLIATSPNIQEQNFYGSSFTQVKTNVIKVLELDPEWIFPGHGKPIHKSKLTQFKKKFLP